MRAVLYVIFPMKQVMDPSSCVYQYATWSSCSRPLGRYNFPGRGVKTSLWVSLHASSSPVVGSAAIHSPKVFGGVKWNSKSGDVDSVADGGGGVGSVGNQGQRVCHCLVGARVTTGSVGR